MSECHIFAHAFCLEMSNGNYRTILQTGTQTSSHVGYCNILWENTDSCLKQIIYQISAISICKGNLESGLHGKLLRNFQPSCFNHFDEVGCAIFHFYFRLWSLSPADTKVHLTPWDLVLFLEVHKCSYGQCSTFKGIVIHFRKLTYSLYFSVLDEISTTFLLEDNWPNLT